MTDDITACQVINKHDDVFITLFTEWLDSGLKITIFSEKSIPLIGQMNLTDVDTFAKNLSKTRTEYLDLTRSILSGKENGVEFILKDLKFRWKKGAWNHGIIVMTESKMEQVYPGVLKKLLRRYSELEKAAGEVKRENEDLRIAQKGLNDKVEELILTKNELEEHLYKRFIVILNSKKERIRELEKQLNTRNGSVKKTEDKIWEADTDPSEEEKEEEEKREKENKTKRKSDKAETSVYSSRAFSNAETLKGEKLLKRQISDSEGNMVDSDYENEEKIKRNCKYAKSQTKAKRKSGELTPAKASTSKNGLKIDEECEGKKITRKVKSLMNFESGESEEDIFADDS